MGSAVGVFAPARSFLPSGSVPSVDRSCRGRLKEYASGDWPERKLLSRTSRLGVAGSLQSHLSKSSAKEMVTRIGGAPNFEATISIAKVEKLPSGG